ncbi:MAG TPA: DinB family protein [Streptosporangiaceae bacterium]|nr:DinB family protein [Streptosporangiaceae bacterium]
MRGLPGAAAGLLASVDEQAQRRHPAPGVWSPLEYAGHCADVMIWYGERIALVLTQDKAQLEPFDWDAQTAKQRYHEAGASEILHRLRRSCDALATRLDSLGTRDWTRTGIGSDGTARSVADLARRAAHEAVHHIEDIRRGIDPP